MPVTLTIEDDRRDEFDGPDVSEVPDGARILIRRCANGADVLVLPGKGARACDVPAKTAEPEPARDGDHMLVQHWAVDRDRSGKVEIVITDLTGLCFSLVLADDVALSLGGCLTAFSPSPAPSHEAALARRATAEAELLELDVAERRRTATDPEGLAASRVSVDGEQQRPGERVLRIGFDDEGGHSILAVVPFGLALKLAGLIGHAVADRVGDPGSA